MLRTYMGHVATDTARRRLRMGEPRPVLWHSENDGPRPYWCIGAVCWPPTPPPPPEWRPLEGIGVTATASTYVVVGVLAFAAILARAVKRRRRHEQ